jgi:hypothetical protein
MIYFDAREVLASLLSCPLLNCDGKYLFDSPEQDPFIGPPKSSIIGDINTGQCYRKTYEAIVKNPFATFASSSLCCAYHVERTTSSSLFFFVGIVQPTEWQGTTSATKERKENYQAVTIDKNSDPVLFSFRRRRSTRWMAGHDVNYKRTKREQSGCDNRQQQRYQSDNQQQ